MTTVNTPCIVSTKAKNAAGYAVIGWNNKTVLHHRLSYCAANAVTLASIKGKVVMHRCDNPGCINPEHLLLGTDADNVADMVSKGRQNFVNNVRGSKQHKAKLTDSIVKDIKQQLKAGKYPVDIAVQYGVTQATISYIKLGKTWKHVE